VISNTDKNKMGEQIPTNPNKFRLNTLCARNIEVAAAAINNILKIVARTITGSQKMENRSLFIENINNGN